MPVKAHSPPINSENNQYSPLSELFPPMSAEVACFSYFLHGFYTVVINNSKQPPQV